MHQSRFSDQYPQICPQIWLMTDARNDDMLEKSIKALPRGSGIVFRHYHLTPGKRRERFEQIKYRARRGDHILLLAGSPSEARQWGADGVYGTFGGAHRGYETAGLLHGAPVHDLREIAMARHHGADLLFLSPAFATRSHPGQRPLHRIQLRRLVALCRKPVMLLGGVDAMRFRKMADLGAHGWAAIDGLSI
ncbi:thiamine phosphate synthase [Parasphingorhabdus sp.]|uniref:thiamine phosphate synthase n=1 Tax=Parasphingorhabdus sp. TaxID=2709688 RepID=UPI002F9435FB